MARTLVQIRQQIEKLEQEAKSVKAKEVAGVVGRIREAIDFYGLTAEDLFGTKAKKVGRPKGVAKVAVKSPTNKKPAQAKFKDLNSDKTWTGHGKRPGWFVDAIASGKSAEDMAIAR